MIWPRTWNLEEHLGSEKGLERDSVQAPYEAAADIEVDAELAAQWSRALDELETALMQDHPPSHWEPPQDLAMMPGSLRQRAGELALAQAAVITTLRISLEAAAAELAAAAPARKTPSALYLDVIG